jgi:hypothetical protein
MSKVAIVGNPSGTGVFTIQSPNTSTDRTLTLPDSTGTIDTLSRAGNVLQVVQSIYSTYTTSTSTTFVDSGITASITPSSTSSKILIFLNPNVGVFRNLNAGIHGSINIVRDSTQVYQVDGPKLSAGTASDGYIILNSLSCVTYLDSPSTTSSTTYKMQWRVTPNANSGTIRLNDYMTTSGDSKSSITLMEIAA